jgi:Ca2+-binding EF-hand superfamily protein
MRGKFFTLTSLAAASVLTILAAPPKVEAQNQRMRFAAMDQNNDGRISREEWRGSDRSFDVHDWNGDGVLSGDEVRPGAQRNTQWEQADHNAGRYERYVSWTASGFSSLDHNRDRRITPNEWHFDRETFRRVDSNRDGALDQQEFLGANVDDDRGDNFDDLDYNNNGWVEQSEWHGSTAVFDRLDRNNDNRLSRFEVAGGSDTNFDTYDEFASVDFNRNGTISRDEWHWSLGSFNQRDLNRDGVLSRREFDATGGANPGAVGTSGGASRTIRVNSQQRWTDSGISVRAGERFNIDASGTVTLSQNGGDTATPAGASSGRRAPDAPVLNQPAGGLIARIDDYGPIYIGSRGTFTAPVGGRLYFGVNDDHLPDNQGEFTVTLSR